MSTFGTTVRFTVNSNAKSLVPGVYGPVTITFTNTTSGRGNTSRTAMLTVDPPVFQGAATLLSVTAACSTVSDLAVGGLAESTYRPRLNPTELGLF